MSTPNNKVVHGARCVILVGGSPIGVFTSVSYGVNYSHQPIYILGRASAAEIAMTGMDVVTVQAHGWRVIGHGPFQGAGSSSSTGGSGGTGSAAGSAAAGGSSAEIDMTSLQDLLTAPDTTIAIVDKTGNLDNKGQVIMQVNNCRIVAMQSQLNSRQAMDFSVTFVGLTYQDEGDVNGQNDPGINLPA